MSTTRHHVNNPSYKQKTVILSVAEGSPGKAPPNNIHPVKKDNYGKTQIHRIGHDVLGVQCARRKVVGALDGVKSVSVSLLTNSMVVDFAPPLTSKDVERAVSDAGYKATPASDAPQKRKANPTLVMLARFIVSAVILIPLMYVSMGVVMWGWPAGALANDPMAIAIYQLVLSFVILAINCRFFVSGTKAILHRAPNMDTLVSMGSLISFVYSVALMIQAGVHPEYLTHLAHNLYFESSAMILVLITLGKTLESYSKGKTTSAIKGLMALAPQTVHVLVDGTEKEVPLSDLAQGDIFVVRPGRELPRGRRDRARLCNRQRSIRHGREHAR